ncbi:MAG: hypothetical protein WB998_08050 [Solirubrobacteraceae bacterium]
MTLRFRGWFLGMVAGVAAVACAAMMMAVPAAEAATPFGVEKFVAANCLTGHETCGEEKVEIPLPPPNPPLVYSVPKEPSRTEAREAGYTQVAGHPAVGITGFQVKLEEGTSIPNAVPAGIATVGPVTHVRTDVAPGVSTNPEAMEKCTMKDFEGEVKAPGVFTPPTCGPNSEIGINKVIVYVPTSTPKDIPLEGKVYNIEQPAGLSSLFGVALELPEALTGAPGLVAHTLIEGHVEWGSDYHDYYEIKVSEAIPLIASRLVLYGDRGTEGKGGFITNPSHCAGTGYFTTNTVTLTSEAGSHEAREYEAPIGTEGCKGENGLTVPPFAPVFELHPETTQSDAPDGITTEASLSHDPSPTGIDSSQLKTASFTLPEGMTLNPSAAAEVTKACTPAQIGIGTRNAVSCPSQSQIGTATLTVPDLPENQPPAKTEPTLQGKVYLGGGEIVTKPPYTIYVTAESAYYDLSVRLKGTVTPNEQTGRLTTVFENNPEQPFSNLKLTFKGGALAPIANPLTCGAATSSVSFSPYTESPLSLSPAVPAFTVDSNGKGGACASPLPFSLGQSTSSVPTTGGSATNFTLNVSRADGQQYLSKISAALPIGLVGKIPVVPLCPEPSASAGTCSAESQIGAVSTTVGSGPTPYRFNGQVYLTGPTNGAPYGMTFEVNAIAGPFNLGTVVARTGIFVEPHTSRVTVAGEIPTIHDGIPLRIKSLSVAINRPGFLVNPTNCGALSTNTSLTSTMGATQAVSTGFQASNCSALAFGPKFGATSNAKTSRTNGAALVTHINYPSGAQANIKSVMVRLPKELPSRLSTLKNACLEAVFKADPSTCPAKSIVGTARVKTPILPGQLSGPAFFVSHGGAAFPDLDLVLTGDGVVVILEGNTNISKGITTTTFAASPDVPFTGFELNLPSGPNSAVAAVGNLCKQSLVMPTTITAQNGKVLKQNTSIMVQNCPVTVVSSHTKGNKAVVTVKVPSAGRVSGGGSKLKTVYKHPGKAKKVTVEVPVKSSGRPLTVRVRIGFIPKSKKEKTSTAYANVRFK